MSSKKPNIVLITADQWRGDCVGYRSPFHPVMTPHINQLAAEGIDFTRAYADCPICMPQRATVLSGKTGATLGKTFNFGGKSRTFDDCSESLPSLLSQKGGYQTKAIGKMHFSPPRSRVGFDHVTLHPNDYVNWLEDVGYGGLYRGHGLGGNEIYPAVSAVPERYSHTHWIVEQSARFISQRDPDNPFFLWMVFEAPHSPFDPPEPYDRMYDNFTIPEPIKGKWQQEENPYTIVEKEKSLKFDEISDEALKESRRKYYGQISHIDYQLGRFLGELKSKGLYDNTVIIFTADHGEHLGDYGLFGKTTYLYGSADVPLIVKPHKDANLDHLGIQCDKNVITADIYNTILDFANVEATATDGLSLVDTVKSVDNERTVFGECSYDGLGNAFASKGKFKYVYFAKGGNELLFDNEKDPYDLEDLSKVAEYDEIKSDLKAKLIDFLAKRNRKMVKDNELVKVDVSTDFSKARNSNPFAWRGPMHFGQGY